MPRLSVVLSPSWPLPVCPDFISALSSFPSIHTAGENSRADGARRWRWGERKSCVRPAGAAPPVAQGLWASASWAVLFLKGRLEVYVKLPTCNTLVNKFKNVKTLVRPNKTNPQAVGLERLPHAFRRPGLPKPGLHEQWTPSPQTGALDRGSVRLTLRQDTAPMHTPPMQAFGTSDNPYVPLYPCSPVPPPLLPALLPAFPFALSALPGPPQPCLHSRHFLQTSEHISQMEMRRLCD